MALNKDFLMGFLSGTVVGAVGYRLIRAKWWSVTALSTTTRVGLLIKMLLLINLL